MEMTAVIQYILTSAQSFGSQDYYNNLLMTMLVYYSAKTSRHRQNGLSFVLKKILTWGATVIGLLKNWPVKFRPVIFGLLLYANEI